MNGVCWSHTGTALPAHRLTTRNETDVGDQYYHDTLALVGRTGFGAKCLRARGSSFAKLRRVDSEDEASERYGRAGFGQGFACVSSFAERRRADAEADYRSVAPMIWRPPQSTLKASA